MFFVAQIRLCEDVLLGWYKMIKVGVGFCVKPAHCASFGIPCRHKHTISLFSLNVCVLVGGLSCRWGYWVSVVQ